MIKLMMNGTFVVSLSYDYIILYQIIQNDNQLIIICHDLTLIF